MSQIIPLGIGSPAEIAQLVLTGLSPASLPPPPVPSESGAEFRTLQSGVVVKSFDSFSSVIFTDGTEFTLPLYPVEITWQVIYGSAPAITDVVIQVSLDGINWITKDESTNTSGELRTFKTTANFIRAAMLNITEGILTTVEISTKRIEGGWF